MTMRKNLQGEYVPAGSALVDWLAVILLVGVALPIISAVLYAR